MKNINFLGQQNKRLTEQAKKDKRVFKYTAAVSAVIIFLTLISVGISFYLKFRLDEVKEDIRTTSNEVSEKKPLEAQYLFFINKLKVIRELFEMRSDKQVAINFFNNLFGPNIKISGINYQMEEGLLSLTVTCPHLFELEEALNTLDDPDIVNRFESFSKNRLLRDEDGSYSFDLTIGLDEESDLIETSNPYLDEEK